MAKTINKDIDIFKTLESAQKAFDKSTVPCQLLSAQVVKETNYYIDRSKTAIIDWPTKYTLINEK